MVGKAKNIEFIKNFSKISVSEVCRKLKIDRADVVSGRASEENTQKVVDELKKEIKDLIDR